MEVNSAMRFDYSLRLLTDKSWQKPQFHFHDNYEILFSLTTAGSIFIDNELFPLENGTLCLIQAGCLHRTRSEVDEFKRYVLQFPETILRDLSDGTDPVASVLNRTYLCTLLSPQDYIQLNYLFDRLYTLSGAERGNTFQCNIALLEILYYIGNILGEPFEEGQPVTSPDYKRIRPVLDYIQEHLDEPLPLDTLSGEFYLSKHYFCHLFKKVTGFSATEYIIRNRLAQARSLLRSGVSVQEAGERSGFGSNAHFIKTFTNVVGTSPGRYAREYRSSHKI
ncbi:AraC family transcriptional regulator [Oscillibacter sp. MSJ-2]|uniref:AraC family transcriptional regulator n=1 Tax=Dysosmobacter acutus TaxID=2841504 RepID=A0ABS6FAX6_9FIRM|nr:AraC family transcriptional regulator [Dysosmobacter acutus]MBU5627441.1 AraC family transcriptional regulator [Dysosmobacter acutus]